ncbi:hypothetical protein RFI_33053, partial [Reticulomyxa filosa]
DLSTYTPLLDALQNTFTSNNVSDSLINIKDASLILSSSTINNHRLIVNSQISNIQLSNIITYGSDVIYLNDTRSSTFGTKLTATNCQFTSQWSNLGVNMNVQSYDQIIWSSSNFSKITFSFESGTDTHASLAHQVYFSQCTFSYYHSQTALIINVPTYHPWLFNSSLHLCHFQHSLNHFTSNPLLLVSSSNRNVGKFAKVSLSNCTVLNNTDVLSILENSSYENPQTSTYPRNTMIELKNMDVESAKGILLYHVYPWEAATDVRIHNSKIWNNAISGSVSAALISLESYDHSECKRMPKPSFEFVSSDTISAAHLIVESTSISKSQFVDGIIKTYCASYHISYSTFDSNEVENLCQK